MSAEKTTEALTEVRLKKALGAVRKTSARERAWWQQAYAHESMQVSLDETLQSLADLAPTRLESELTSETPVWHLLLLGAALHAQKHTVLKTAPRKPTVVVGDLHVAAALELRAPLLVTGNLTVDGPIVDTGRRGVSLLVAGSVRATAVVSCQDFAVGGDCHVREVVVGFEPRRSLVVRGTLAAPLLVLAGDRPHRFGKSRVGHTLHNPEAEALLEHFEPALVVDGNFQLEALIRQLKKGQAALVSLRAAP